MKKHVNSAATIATSNALSGRTLLIVEDQRLLADFFAHFCRELGLQVLDCSGSLAAGLAAFRRLDPELILLDLSLPDGDGLDLARIVLEERPATKILAISSHCDPWTMLRVQRLGLHGFVDKNEQSSGILAEAIRAVLAGRVHYAPVVNEASAAVRRNRKGFNRVLSDYDIKVLALIGEAKDNAEIGVLLGISPSTAQSHRSELMDKLDVHSTPKLIHYAIVNGFTRTDHLRCPLTA